MLNNFAILGLSGVAAAIVIAVLLAILAFEIAMLVSVIRNEHVTSNNKVLWVV